MIDFPITFTLTLKAAGLHFVRGLSNLVLTLLLSKWHPLPYAGITQCITLIQVQRVGLLQAFSAARTCAAPLADISYVVFMSLLL